MTDYDYRNIDDVIHSRVRLAIMSYLMTAKEADFTELKTALKVSDGNLSTHLTKLEGTGYVTQEKKFVGKKPQTSVQMTPEGEAAFKAYLEGLAAMIGPQQ
ncbi:winged helix-turn-helix domain-containing protein [Kordiimonas lacus]|uniref:DNA-binding transcriptional regulator, MarR family n=1 Tax=Kordiimonas lacus TaxID=637679 RepID=A0A1G6TS61_9PROT|nr:transcriptional regulator [Kordiimonas lacus]SDD31943.1 DNA-binding transcriptional regulator, MarR family [Kordiimonas lacus]